MRTILLIPLFVLIVGSTQAGTVENEIRKVIASRVDSDPRLVGLVIGLERGSDRAVLGWGRLGAAGTPVPDGDTVFEIGSVTKVFTARLLSDFIDRRQARLDDPAESLLPPGVRLPRSASARTFTLLQLAEHSSGLPRLPSNLAPKNPADPYADYTEALLHEFLKTYVLDREPGSKVEYSNLGYGLLGYLLATKTGVNYASLIQDRIAGPLGMTRTAVVWSGPMAQGHDLGGQPVPNWDLGALPGAGALRSTANDLLKFIAAEAAKMGTPLGWVEDNGSFWHNGQTGGFHTFIGFHRPSGTRVVVLANAAVSIDDIGAHLLNGSPLAAPPQPRKELVLAPAILEAYVGRYELAADFTLTVRHDGNHLKVQATGQPELTVFAESETEFFYKAVEASITFRKNASGHVTGLTLHQSGDQEAHRLP